MAWSVEHKEYVDYLVQCFEKAGGEFIIDGITVQNEYTEKPRPPSEEPVTEDKWYNFDLVSNGVWRIVIEDDVSNEKLQDEEREDAEHEDFDKATEQSAAICVMAIVFSKVSSVEIPARHQNSRFSIIRYSPSCTAGLRSSILVGRSTPRGHGNGRKIARLQRISFGGKAIFVPQRHSQRVLPIES